MRNNFIKKAVKQYGFKSLLLRNGMIIFLVLAVPLAIISLITFVNSNRNLEKEKNNIIRERLNKIVYVNDEFFQSMNRLSAVMCEKNTIRSVIQIEESKINQSSNYSDITHELSMASMSYMYIEAMFVYSSLNDYVITASTAGKLTEIENMQWINRYLDDERSFYVTSLIYNNKPSTMIVRRVKSATAQNPGFLFIIIDNQKYIKSFDISSSGTEEFAIVDKITKSLIFASNDNFNIKKMDGMKKAASTAFEWEYYYNAENIYMDLENRNMPGMAIIFASFFLLCVFLAIMLTLKTFAPIQYIIDYLSQSKRDEEQLDQDFNELSYITRNIWSLIGENETLTDELERRVLLLNNAQIYALQYQINPHFIYNTLEAIKWLVIEIEPKNNHNASKILGKLSKIFKYSLNMKNYLVTLEEEINNTKDYISILQLRYQNLFEVKWSISEDLYQHKVVKLSLQPLIENAVFHGLQSMHSGGIIEISAQEHDSKFYIRVADNGVGMEKKEAAKLQNNLDNQDAFSGKNVGLSNLNRRIKLMLGDEYGLKINAENGFCVTVILP